MFCSNANSSCTVLFCVGAVWTPLLTKLAVSHVFGWKSFCVPVVVKAVDRVVAGTWCFLFVPRVAKSRIADSSSEIRKSWRLVGPRAFRMEIVETAWGWRRTLEVLRPSSQIEGRPRLPGFRAVPGWWSRKSRSGTVSLYQPSFRSSSGVFLQYSASFS